MKYRLMDILACPMCKHFPLELYVLKENYYEKRELGEREKPVCELYCGYLRKNVSELKEPPCDECFKREVGEGVLYCPSCGRWYPIVEEIPRMLPDELRNGKEDLEFLSKYKDKLPEKIVHEGKPFNLKTS